MQDAQPGRFRELSHGPLARRLGFLKTLAARAGLGDLLASLFISGLTVLMVNSSQGLSQIPFFKEGQVASVTVRAPRAFEVEDQDAMENDRQQILQRVPDVYDFDSKAVLSWSERWKTAIRQMRSARYRSLEDGVKALSEKLGLPLTADDYRVLQKLDFSPDLERSIALSLAPLWDQKIAANRGVAPQGAQLVDIQSLKSHLLHMHEIDAFLSLEEAVAQVGRAGRGDRVGNLRLPWARWSPSIRAAVFEIQSRLVAPNVTLNRKETEARRAEALKGMRTSFQKLERGEVIVREGERVTRRDAGILKGLHAQAAGKQTSDTRLAQTVFGTFCLWLLLFSIRRQFPKLLQQHKDALVAALFLVSSLAMLKLSLIFQLNVLAEPLATVPEAFLIFLIPVAAPAMTIRLLMNAPMTLLFSWLYALGASLVVGKAALFGLYVLVSCLTGSLFLLHCRTRSSLYKAGLWTALACGLGAAFLMAAWGGQIPLSGAMHSARDLGEALLPAPRLLLWAFAGGCVGGWLSSALTLVMTPLFESLLEYTTDLKLLELARMDHPLLRDLVLKAPGTYHHSIIVGSLVEAGAEAVGANALLARVGAYYHDIGKIHRPEYFVENQVPSNNPHDHTTPQLSAKIIISHVKEGRALAEQYKLGRGIIDFIEQHHGTSLVGYFFNKAKQQSAQPGSTLSPDEVQEADFRYPGPRPQSKEAAIMALADSVEAATRSLVEPTPARLEGMVNKIIQKAFDEGLLDEADITLREIHLVTRAFLRILLGIHHNRIQYPDQEKGLPPRPVKAAPRS